MANAHERWQTVVEFSRRVWIWVRPKLRWLAEFIGGLIWLAVFCVLRVCEVSKRLVAVAGLIALGCFGAVWQIGRYEGWLGVMLVCLGFALVLTVAAQPWWVDYRQKLGFLVDSHPRAAALLVDGDLYQRPRAALGSVGRWALAGVAAFGLAVLFWQKTGWEARTLLAGTVCAVTSISFGMLAGMAGGLESRRGVLFFLRGWRLADPDALEQQLCERWPETERIVIYRRRWTEAVAPLLRAPYEALARPYGSLTG